MKTVEELLVQRYKVIADYPQSALKVGDIISFELQHVEIAKYTALNGDPIKLAVMEKTVQKYPHLFEPLPWWSDRKIEDMPEYVKSIAQEYSYGVVVGDIIKVKEWVLLSETMYVIQSKTREYHPSCFVPSTREEYEAFKQQKEG